MEKNAIELSMILEHKSIITSYCNLTWQKSHQLLVYFQMQN